MSIAQTEPDQALRQQRACVLGVRFTWRVTGGHQHPKHTFTCAEDPAMAALMASHADLTAPGGMRVVGLAVSPSSGRHHPWESLEWAAAGDRLLVRRGKWIYLPEPGTPGWFLITNVAPRINDAMQPVTRITVNGRGPAYIRDFLPRDTVALRTSHPDL